MVSTMDRTSMDHYEKQLYTVFKTFDVDNEEALDKSAVLDLCDALQLEDRGAALVDTLFERPAERVTFTQFRNGLLTVLGAGAPSTAAPSASSTPSVPSTGPHSDDDSSGREVAPKFVYGSKKYGRRSRPPGTPTPVHAAAPARPLHTNSGLDTENEQFQRRMKCMHTAAGMEGENSKATTSESNDLDHDRRIDYEQSLDLCRTLNMDGIDRRLVERIFQDASSNEITVGEFFDRLNASLTMSIASTCGEEDESCREGALWGSTLTADVVVETWERAGVEHARRLLLELGFSAPTLRASQLARALDTELNAVAEHGAAPDARAILLQASLALQRLRLAHTAHRADAAHAENVKLRADLADANRRAQTLAQEVDENHAQIEASLKGRIKQLETRHAEEIRAIVAEISAERERSAAAVLQLEQTVAQLTAEESRLRLDTQSLRERNEELARRASLAEDKANELEAAREALIKEMAVIECHSNAAPVEDNAATELAGTLEQLRLENKILRDRNDELCVEVEAAGRMCAGVGADTGWREEGLQRAPRTLDDSLASLHSVQNFTDECDHSLISLDQKVLGHMEVVRKLQGVLQSVPQVTLSDDSGCESCGTLKGIITTIQERVQELGESVIITDQSGLRLDTSIEASVQTESFIEEELDKLKNQLLEVDRKHTDEKQRLNELVQDLEASLEQLKVDYDKCEEYWTNKLEEERDIYNEEQKISDDRLTELIAKISEYEQQFAPKETSNRLPTIDEKYSLEVQFADLEDEFDKYKKDNETELASKNDEITKLKERVKTLEDKAISISNGHPNGVTSPIDYLWSQGTIHTPYKNTNRCVRDYHNPAYAKKQPGEGVRCSSDSEKDVPSVSPIQRPALAQRSSSVGALRSEDGEAPQMINCADLEGRLRQQAQTPGHSTGAGRAPCACPALEARCRQLAAALRHRQLCLDAVQQAARSEGAALRARVAATEGAVARLQSRLAAADLLIKDLYLENCQLAHQPTRLL